MSYYVIYNRENGQILLTHATYVMGQDTPVDTDLDELIEQTREDFDEDIELAVAKAPSNFDPAQRTYRLKVDLDSGKVVTEAVKPKTKKKRG